jgi:hypothetical protein
VGALPMFAASAARRASRRKSFWRRRGPRAMLHDSGKKSKNKKVMVNRSTGSTKWRLLTVKPGLRALRV